MKKIFTLMMAMTLMASSAFATTIYCKMEHGWWKADGAAIGAYAWTGDGESAQSNANWPGVRMTATAQADVWSVDIDLTKYEKIIFTRMNPGNDGDLDWGAKTKDLVIPTDGKNLFTITTSEAAWGDPGCDGEWSVMGDEPGPGPQPSTGEHDYYLMGNLTGAQGGDITVPTPEELFECGTLTYSFPGHAANGNRGYFFVMVCDPGSVIGVGYMAKVYSEDTHTTLYSQQTEQGANERLGVPGPTATFYLYDNGDGTLELSTVPLAGKTLVGGCEEQAIENTIVTEKAHKQIIDGQLRIIRGDKMYDATGKAL